jgi:AraC-like DNA-binding protein
MQTRVSRVENIRRTIGLQKPVWLIKKIAGHIGYETVTGFYLAFKKEYGMSPGAFRKQNIKNDR